MSNVLEAISKLKVKITYLILSYTCQLTAKQAYETTFETTCKTSLALTNSLLTRGHYLVKNSFFVISVELKDVSSCEI